MTSWPIEWDWYIYQHEWLIIYGKLVGKYTPMDAMGEGERFTWISWVFWCRNVSWPKELHPEGFITRNVSAFLSGICLLQLFVPIIKEWQIYRNKFHKLARPLDSFWRNVAWKENLGFWRCPNTPHVGCCQRKASIPHVKLLGLRSETGPLEVVSKLVGTRAWLLWVSSCKLGYKHN